jgi:hypothetical protein
MWVVTNAFGVVVGMYKTNKGATRVCKSYRVKGSIARLLDEAWAIARAKDSTHTRLYKIEFIEGV